MPQYATQLQNRPPGEGLGLRRLACLAAGLLMVGATALASGGELDAQASSEVMEYQLKAGFLFNFAKFVQWPTNNLSTNEFRIGILDDGIAYSVLDAALAGKSIENRIVKVARVSNTNDAASCQMLFVSRSASERSRTICRKVSALPILTVGEETTFAAHGGCINLIPHQQRIRFEINLKAAEKAGLKISAKLASMATLVDKEEK